MQPFTCLTAVAEPLLAANVDTDQLLPARFLRKPRDGGYQDYLFYDLRRRADGSLDPDFVLNDPRYADARILVADDNFGCGSSREGAVYALVDAGFRAVLAPGFGDIFAGNAVNNGLLAGRIDHATRDSLWRALAAQPGLQITVDLEAHSIAVPGGEPLGFAVEAARRARLLAGQDDIDLTLAFEDEVAAFAGAYEARHPWSVSAGRPKAQ